MTATSLTKILEDVLPSKEKKLARQMTKTLAAALIEGCRVNGGVRVPGVGTLVLKDLPARKARNPRTGETIEIAARKRVSFRVAPSLRKTLV